MSKVVMRHSPNFNARPAGVLLTAIVMHATASKDCQQDVDWLCNRESQASSHVVIDRDGTIYDLVPITFRAWHAGVSALNGRSDVNDFSVGIELANDNEGEAYSDAQLDAAAVLCASYCREWPGITVERIVTHAMVALPPGRKTDAAPPFDLEAFRTLVRQELDR